MKKIAYILSGNTMGWGDWAIPLAMFIKVANIDESTISFIDVGGHVKYFKENRYQHIKIQVDDFSVEYHAVPMGCSVYRAGLQDKFDEIRFIDCPEEFKYKG